MYFIENRFYWIVLLNIPVKVFEFKFYISGINSLQLQGRNWVLSNSFLKRKKSHLIRPKLPFLSIFVDLWQSVMDIYVLVKKKYNWLKGLFLMAHFPPRKFIEKKLDIYNVKIWHFIFFHSEVTWSTAHHFLTLLSGFFNVICKMSYEWIGISTIKCFLWLFMQVKR